MFNHKMLLPAPIIAKLFLIAILLLSSKANANISSLANALGLLNAACPTGLIQVQALEQLKFDIATTESVDQARAMALAPTDDALDALSNANAIMPFSDELNAAKNRLSEARLRILAATSQRQVADEFSGLMLAGLDDNAANLSIGKASCNYTTGETIAIVLGLILGIIPGLILLVLLC
jgi:hypothetical protein